MKIKKVLLYIVIVSMLLSLMPSFAYANMAPIASKYLISAAIMRISVFAILLIYILSSIIYLVKSNKSKNEKIKKLVLWLIIIAIICLILWYGADFIFKNARRW